MSQSSKRWIIGLVVLVVLVFVGAVGAVVYGLSKVGTAVAGRTNRAQNTFKMSSSSKAVLMRVEGVIEAEMAADILAQVEEIRKTDGIQAVLVRVDSPGGTVGASQEIFEALKGLRAKGKQVYCSFGDLAASGGYYIAMGCEKIYSNPGTLTGSIGVIMQFVNLKDLYAWAKIQPEVLKAGKFKDIGSETRAMREDERALLQKLLDDTHGQFRAAVLEGRPTAKPEMIEDFADGRILSGSQALELGLVDVLGSLDAAKAGLLAAAKLDPETEIEEFFPDVNPWEGLFGGPRRRRRTETPIASDLKGIASELRDVLRPGLHVKPGVPYYLPPFLVE